jgi:hypothetical protein
MLHPNVFIPGHFLSNHAIAIAPNLRVLCHLLIVAGLHIKLASVGLKHIFCTPSTGRLQREAKKINDFQIHCCTVLKNELCYFWNIYLEALQRLGCLHESSMAEEQK